MGSLTIDHEFVQKILSFDSCSQRNFAKLLSMYNDKDYEYYVESITSSTRAMILTIVFKPGPCLMVDGVNLTPEWDDSPVYKTQDLINWAKLKGLNISSVVSVPLENKALSLTERSKLLAMVLGMAMDSYGYVPGGKRNTATGEKNNSIRAALQRLGLDADDETIRDYLSEASDLYKDVLKAT